MLRRIGVPSVRPEPRDVEDLLAERGVAVSYETNRDWLSRLGHQFAGKIRRDRSVPTDKWHLDEIVIRTKGRSHWLWRAVDANGDVFDLWTGYTIELTA